MVVFKEQIDPNRPFLGLKSYEEYHQSIFGGREKEIDKLVTQIGNNRLSVVFGKSGIGKTSLLKAGLLPKLRRNFYLPIYVRVNFLSMDTPLEQVKNEIEQQIMARDEKAIRFGDLSLWEYFHKVKVLDGMLQPVLILDQFEELFTLGKPKSKQVNELVRELGDLAENRVPRQVQERHRKSRTTVSSRFAECPYNVVLSLREDYLPNLESMKRYMPSIKDSRFRVLQMNGEQAVKAIVKSGKRIIDEATAISLVKKIPKSKNSGLDVLDDQQDWRKIKVEPFLVSLVCFELNEIRLQQDLPSITKALVDTGDIENTIATHYENSVIKKFGKEACTAIEELLVTTEGYRKLCIKSDFIEKFEVSEDTVDALVNTRIIRQETRNGVEYIELIHDVLAPLIKERRDYRHAEETRDRQRAEMEKILKERAAKSKQWVSIYRSLGAVLLIAVVVSSYFYMKAKEAKGIIEGNKKAIEAYRDTVETKLAVIRSKEESYAELLDDARQREDTLVAQLKALKADAYENFRSESYEKNIQEAKQLFKNKEYKKANAYYNVAKQYAQGAETSEIDQLQDEIDQKITINQRWAIDIFYLEGNKDVTLPLARKIAPIFEMQGFKVRIRMLTIARNAHVGYQIKNNQIRIDKDEHAVGKRLLNALELNGYNDFQTIISNQSTAGYCSVFVHDLSENKALTKIGNQLFEDGWVYVGEYVEGDNSWKTRYLDFEEKINQPAILKGEKVTVRDETGQLNVRKSMPDRKGQFGDIVQILQPGTEVEIKTIKNWGGTGYVWALVSYRVE